MNVAIDLILLTIVILCVWTGHKKGLIMGIGGMVAVIVSLYVACLISTTYSYEIVPAVRPFASGFVESQMTGTVLDNMGLSNTELSVNDILEEDPTLRHQFCYECFRSVGIYDDAAEQMATEAEEYAADQDTDINTAVVEILSGRITFVAGIVLCFIVLLIILTAIGNITNLSFKIPNMDRLNDVGGAVVGFIKGAMLCMLLCWALRFAGLFIGVDTLGKTILGRFFILIDFITIGIGI